jgi:hypothetical protein
MLYVCRYASYHYDDSFYAGLGISEWQMPSVVLVRVVI